MAKNYVDLTGLSKYHELISQYINTEDAKSIKSLSRSGNTVSFYKTNDATGTPAYQVEIPDVSGFMSKITSALGGKIVTSVAGGEVAESETAISDLATNAFVGSIPNGSSATTVTGYAKEVADSKDSAISAAQSAADDAQSDVDNLEALVGTLPSGVSSTTVTGYVDEAIATAVGALDTQSDVGVASKSGKTVTISGSVKEVDGVIQKGTATDITLADVASTGNAEDITVADSDGNFTSTDLEGVLSELAEATAGGVASKTVYVTEVAGGSSDAYSKRYSIYQGSTGSSASPVAGEKLVDIDLPKDMVVSDATCRKATAQDVSDAGENPGFTVGDYIIVLTIANNDGTKIYIPVQSLVDIYTAEQNASQIQLVIDNNNEISATIVNGSVDTNALANSAVTTAKIADDAVTADKVAISAHTESQVAGADGIAISVTTTDGQVSSVSASIASGVYDPAGSASSAQSAAESYADDAIADLDAVADSTKTAIDGSTSRTAQNGGVFALQAVTEDGGKLTAMTAVEVDAAGSAASAQSAAQSYADGLYADIDSVPVASIEALFTPAQAESSEE